MSRGPARTTHTDRVGAGRARGLAVAFATVLAVALGASGGCGGSDPGSGPVPGLLAGVADDDEAGLSFSDGITRMGISAYMAGDLRRAERLLKGAIAHAYRDTVARYYLANAYVARGTPAGRIAAEEVLTGLAEISEGHPEYLMTLARLRLRQGFRSNARDMFERVLELTPDDASVLTELATLAEADWWRFQVQEDRDRTLDLYRRALRADPDARLPRLRLAVIALEEDRLEVARAHVDTLVRQHPTDPDVRLLTGVVHEATGDFATASRAFDQALDDLPGFDRLAYVDPFFLEPDTVQVWNELVGSVAGEDSVFVPPFWDEHDPSPGTPLNERFVVHASRTAMADFLYGDDDLALRGWQTAPGEFYIRYGRPLRRRYELVSGRGSFPQPTWLHLFDVGGRAVEVRFVDYTLNGRFRLPIENDPAPVHAILRRTRPENGRLGERVTRIPLLHAEAWFREPGGEPRLQVAAAGDASWQRAEVVVRDSTWEEVFALAEDVTPSRWPGGEGVGGATVFELAIHPGRTAHRVELSLGNQGRMTATLDPPPAAEGFGVSDLWLGFLTPRGFVPNPGLPVPSTTPMAVRFEVYEFYRDPSGRGYLEAQVSVVPVEGTSNPILEAIRGRTRASFVAATLEEEPETEVWNRELEVDVSRLSSGTYELRLEVRDTITGETAEARRRFEVRG